MPSSPNPSYLSLWFKASCPRLQPTKHKAVTLASRTSGAPCRAEAFKMQSEARVTRSRAKAIQTIGRTSDKSTETPLPRAALFEVTNNTLTETPAGDPGPVKLELPAGSGVGTEEVTVEQLLASPIARLTPEPDWTVKKAAKDAEQAVTVASAVVPASFMTPASKTLPAAVQFAVGTPKQEVEDSSKVAGQLHQDYSSDAPADQVKEQLGGGDLAVSTEGEDPESEGPLAAVMSPNTDIEEERWQLAELDMPKPLTPAQVAAVEVRAIRSKVVQGSAYDPRSLRQLKDEVKSLLAAKANTVATDDEDTSSESGTPMPASSADGAELVSALEGLCIANQALRGVEPPRGTHTRFTEEGEAVPGSANGKVVLRGLPMPQGSHIRFDD